LYRHLRQLEQQRSVPPSPSSSGFLPSPASSDTPTGHDGKRRSRAHSAASTSSSEATARPAAGVAGPSKRQLKGKQRASHDESEGGDDSTILPPKSEATAVPTKVYVHHPPPRAPSPADERAAWLRTTMRLLPPALAGRLEALAASGWLVPALLPLPAFIVIALFAVQRRRRRAAGAEVMSVRERLRQVRMHGLRPWLTYWLRWWVEKLKGVWNLGTTITYM
jgi:hypothetical protein